MVENKFEEVMSEHPDEVLIGTLKTRHMYQKEAVDAAIKEAVKRRLILNEEDLDTKYPVAEVETLSVSDAEQELVNERAKKDMLYGALWCVGGLVATAAEIGYIFWGAIVFGGVQCIKGLMNYKSKA
jgi:hypothetical protein